MKRDIYSKLVEWKNSKDRKPLILKGARQVGKTYILKEFGRKEYHSFAYFNFEEDPNLKSIFTGRLSPDYIFDKLSAYFQKKLTPEYLIIFDEIQDCPAALTSLKYIYESAKEYHVIASGSYLGMKLGQNRSFPVGKVNHIELFPMSFFEFIEAAAKGMLRNMLEAKDNFEKLDEVFHVELLDLLKKYFFIGGMPGVVKKYISNGDYEEVRKTQKEILKDYESDFAKHTEKNIAIKMRAIWESIPAQLTKENKKFAFSDINSSARYREYIEPLILLKSSGYIHMSNRIKKPYLPLKAYAEENIFKLFFLDTGLLGAMLNISQKTIVEGNKYFDWYNGAFTENFVAQELIASGQEHLYYWTSGGKAKAEIDFIIPYNEDILPLDVKAGSNRKAKSLRSYFEKYNPEILSRVSQLNFRKGNKYFDFPLYAIKLFPIILKLK